MLIDLLVLFILFYMATLTISATFLFANGNTKIPTNEKAEHQCLLAVIDDIYKISYKKQIWRLPFVVFCKRGATRVRRIANYYEHAILPKEYLMFKVSNS